MYITIRNTIVSSIWKTLLDWYIPSGQNMATHILMQTTTFLYCSGYKSFEVYHTMCVPGLHCTSYYTASES